MPRRGYNPLAPTDWGYDHGLYLCDITRELSKCVKTRNSDHPHTDKWRMGRQTREQRIIPSIPNHIISRGNNRRRLFSYPSEYLRYLRLLADACKQYECRLHAICLMANHVHLVITPPSVAAISRVMQRTNQRYAQVRNKRREGSGKLFEQSFFSEPILTIRHLSYCILYVNANPVRAGLRNADKFPWSTSAIHRGVPGQARIPDSMIELDPWYVSLGVGIGERGKEYRSFFESYLAGEIGEGYVDSPAHTEVFFTSRKRLLRPNGSSAAEAFLHYGQSHE